MVHTFKLPGFQIIRADGSCDGASYSLEVQALKRPSRPSSTLLKLTGRTRKRQIVIDAFQEVHDAIDYLARYVIIPRTKCINIRANITLTRQNKHNKRG
jgi:hypothetical protein